MVNGLTITASIALKRDKTGRLMVSTFNCVANVGSASIKFHGGARYMEYIHVSELNTMVHLKLFRMHVTDLINPQCHKIISMWIYCVTFFLKCLVSVFQQAGQSFHVLH